MLNNLFWWSIPTEKTMGPIWDPWAPAFPGGAELRHLQRPAAAASASGADHRFTAGPEGLELIDLGFGEFDEGVFRSPAT